MAFPVPNWFTSGSIPGILFILIKFLPVTVKTTLSRPILDFKLSESRE